MGRRRKAKKLPLLDVPHAWLFRLIASDYCDHDSKLSLFQACRLLSDMVMQHSETIHVRLALLATDTDPQDLFHKNPHVPNYTQVIEPTSCAVQTDLALRVLQRAGRHGRNIRLRLCPGLDYLDYLDKWVTGSWQEHDSLYRQLGEDICNLLQAAGEQGAIEAVSKLRVEGARFDTLLPPAIGDACLYLTKLSLHNCRVTWNAAVSFSSAFPYLQFLKLVDVVLEQSSTGATETSSTEAAKEIKHVQAQLKGLTNLQSLKIHKSCGFSRANPSTTAEMHIVNALASQLTHLRLDMQCGVELFAGLHWVQLGATLQALHLPHLTLNEMNIGLFLHMPSVKTLEVYNIELRGSFAGEPCRWEELICTLTTFESLAHLPLHSGLELKVGVDEVRSPTFFLGDYTADVVQQAVQNVRKCRGIWWGKYGVVLDLAFKDRPGAVDPRPYLAQALPMFRTAKSLHFLNEESLDEDIVQACCDLMRGRQDEPTLGLGIDCVLDAADNLRLVESMPEGGCLCLTFEDAGFEDRITQLCSAVQHRLTLMIKKKSAVCLGRGYKERLTASVQSRFPHITLWLM